MPLLRQSQDGHYYIRGAVPGAGGRYATWQVTPAGVDFLKRRGVQIGTAFPGDLIRELNVRGCLSTGGGGLGPEQTVEALISLYRSPQVGVEETDQHDEPHWAPVILFPEFPKQLLHGDTNANRLTEIAFVVGKGATLPAVRLWPGRGGESVRVPPQDDPYQISLKKGAWPKTWDRPPWLGNSVLGLTPEGTLFAGPDAGGRRLRPAEYLVADARYYFTCFGNSHEIPRSIKRRPLGFNDGWRAWEIHLPRENYADVRTWCKKHGHSFREMVCTSTLLSPPPTRYIRTGLPVLPAGRDVLMVVRQPRATATAPIETLEVQVVTRGGPTERASPGTAARLHVDTSDRTSDAGVGYLIMPAPTPDLYSIVEDRGRFSGTAYLVEAKPPRQFVELADAPSALQVTVAIRGAATRIPAFRDNDDPVEILYDPSSTADALEVELRCPVAATVSWRSLDGARGRIRWGPSESAPPLFVEDMAGTMHSGNTCDVLIDAGSFGAVSIRITPKRSAVEADQLEGQHPTAARVRYVTQQLRSFARPRHCHLVPLPAKIAGELRAAKIGPLTVPALTRGVAVSLLPHLRAVLATNRRPKMPNSLKASNGPRRAQERELRGGR